MFLEIVRCLCFDMTVMYRVQGGFRPAQDHYPCIYRGVGRTTVYLGHTQGGKGWLLNVYVNLYPDGHQCAV